LLKDVERQSGVIVDAVDDNLHQVNAKRLDLWLVVGQDLHGEREELWDELIGVAAHVQHDDLSKLATADAVDTADLVILENGADHINHSVEVSPVLHECLGSVVDEVLQSGQHICIKLTRFLMACN
jgi:hypothetical protein